MEYNLTDASDLPDNPVAGTKDCITYKVPFASNQYLYKDLSTADKPRVVPLSKANMISSVVYEEDGVKYHRPLLDLDLSAVLLPSSTPGHSHLYIDKIMPEEDYRKLIDVLVEVGILQKGIKELQMDAEGHTALRLPSVKKKPGEVSSDKTLVEVNEVPTESVATEVLTKVTDVQHPQQPGKWKEFTMLTELASKTGQNLEELVKAWDKFNNVMPEAKKSPMPKAPEAPF